MHHARRIRMLVILLAGAGALVVSGAAPVETADSPTVDRSQSSCATTLAATQIEILPTVGRDFTGIAGLTPGVFTPLNVSFRFNRRGAPTHMVVDGQEMDFEARVRRFNPENCEVITQSTKAVFGRDPVAGVVSVIYRTEPQNWAQINFSNLRRGAERFPNFRLEYGRGAGTAGPIPADPGTPAAPAPGDTTPGFGGLQNRGGPIIRDGGSFFGSFKPRQHSPEECARHTVNGVALCNVLGGGSTTVQVFNATPSGFGYRGVGGSIPNLSFGDGYCNVDRCETQGTFFDQPVRKTLDGWRASGTDLLADTTVFFNQSQFRLDYRGRYSPPGSTEVIVPPVVPYVPPPAPPPPGGFVLYTGGPTLPEGTRLNFEMSVLPHNTHEAHAVDWQGRRLYLCQKGVGVSEAVIRNIRAPNAFDLVRTAPPRPGFEWSTFNCTRVDLGGPIACNGKGSFYGQDVLARGTTLIQPGSTSAEGTLDVEFVQTKSIVPFSLKYSF